MRLKLFTFKRTLILGIVIAAVVFLLPTFTNTWPHKKINLGLDLQGGMHLVLEVQNEKAVEAELERTISELKKDLREQGIKHLGITRTPDNKILAKIAGTDSRQGLKNSCLTIIQTWLSLRLIPLRAGLPSHSACRRKKWLPSRKWPLNRPLKPSGTGLTSSA